MMTQLPTNIPFSYRQLKVLISLLLLVVMLTTIVVTPVQAISFGSIFNTAKNVLEDVNCILTPGCGLIDQLGEETRATLREAAAQVERLVALLEETYQDNLEFTLDQLDEFTRLKLLELEDFLLTLNDAIQDTVKLVSGEVNATIDNVGEELRATISELEQSIENILVVAFEGVVYILDRATLNIIVIVAAILLGVGLIVFAALLFNARKNASPFRLIGIAVMLLHVLFFGALTLSADFRGRMVVSTQIGLQATIDQAVNQPEVTLVQPNPINLSEENRLEIWGANLVQDGLTPIVDIDGQTVPIANFEDGRLILDTTNLSFGNNVTANLNMLYEDPTNNITLIVKINEVVAQPRPTTVGLTIKLLNARFPAELNNFFAVPILRVRGNDAISTSPSLFIQSGTNIRPSGTHVIVAAIGEEPIDVRVSLAAGPVLEVDRFDLDWLDLNNCDGDGKCSFTREADARLQGELVSFTVTYCMTVSGTSVSGTRFDNATTFGDPCNPPVLEQAPGEVFGQ